jgi:hypothetical protein
MRSKLTHALSVLALAIASSGSTYAQLISGTLTGNFSSLSMGGAIVTAGLSGSMDIYALWNPSTIADGSGVHFQEQVSAGSNVFSTRLEFQNLGGMNDNESAIFNLTFTPTVGAPTTLATFDISAVDSPGNRNEFISALTGTASGTILAGATTFTYNVTAPDFLQVIDEDTLFSGTGVNNQYITVTFAPSSAIEGFQPVPEPATYALFGTLGMAGIVALRRFRTKRLGA